MYIRCPKQVECIRVESVRVCLCLGFHHEVARNTNVVVETGLAAEVTFNSRSCTCEDPSLVRMADVALKETAPRHTLLEGGNRPGENIDRLSAHRPSVCCFIVTDRAPSFICNFASGPQMPCSSSLISQREGAANGHFTATGGGDRFEVTAVEADAEGSCPIQGPIQTKISWLSIIELVTFK